MELYCHILSETPQADLNGLCVAQAASPRLLAVAERSAAATSQKFQSDQQMRDELGAVKGVRLWQFDGVFPGRQKAAAVFGKVFQASLHELYDGNSCLVLNAVANCRE